MLFRLLLFFWGGARVVRRGRARGRLILIGGYDSLSHTHALYFAYQRVCASKPKVCFFCYWKERRSVKVWGEQKRKRKNKAPSSHHSLSRLISKTHCPLRQELRELEVLGNLRLGAHARLDVLHSDVGAAITDCEKEKNFLGGGGGFSGRDE